MQTNDIAKLNKIIKSIKINCPKIKINIVLLSDGSSFACINKICLAFKNVRELVRTLVFLYNAKFTPYALNICKKEKTTKKKEFFFFWVANCINYGHQKGRTLEDLRNEFNALYGLEIKQGRKKKVTHAEQDQKPPNFNEAEDG